MGSSERSKLRAVLFDRDGTLVIDVPYNGDPGKVRPMPGAKAVRLEARSPVEVADAGTTAPGAH